MQSVPSNFSLQNRPSLRSSNDVMSSSNGKSCTCVADDNSLDMDHDCTGLPSNLHVCFEKMICQLDEDAELSIFLYDHSNDKQLTESFQVALTDKGTRKSDDNFHSLGTIFIDVLRNKPNAMLWIKSAFMVVRISKGLSYGAHNDVKGMPRPYGARPVGVSVISLDKVLAFQKMQAGTFILPIYQCDPDMNFTLFHKTIIKNWKLIHAPSNLAQSSLTMQICFYHDSLVSVFTKHYLDSLALSYNIGSLPMTIVDQVDPLRKAYMHELYLTINKTNLPKVIASRRNESLIGLVVSMRQANVQVMRVSSSVYMHSVCNSNATKFSTLMVPVVDQLWNETIRISFPASVITEAFLHFEYIFSDKEGVPIESTTSLFSYLRLSNFCANEGYIDIKDGQHKLHIYKTKEPVLCYSMSSKLKCVKTDGLELDVFLSTRGQPTKPEITNDTPHSNLRSTFSSLHVPLRQHHNNNTGDRRGVSLPPTPNSNTGKHRRPSLILLMKEKLSQSSIPSSPTDVYTPEIPPRPDVFPDSEDCRKTTTRGSLPSPSELKNSEPLNWKKMRGLTSPSLLTINENSGEDSPPIPPRRRIHASGKSKSSPDLSEMKRKSSEYAVPMEKNSCPSDLLAAQESISILALELQRSKGYNIAGLDIPALQLLLRSQLEAAERTKFLLAEKSKTLKKDILASFKEGAYISIQN